MQHEMTDTQIKHEGVSVNRTKGKHHHGNLERIFAEEWRETNAPPRWLNGGHGTLELLIASDGNGWVQRAVTQEEATAAATVVQWLGSPVGFDWLCETLKKCGYTVQQKGRFDE